MSLSENQKDGRDQQPSPQHGHEVIGTLYGCTFEISTVIPPGTYRLDGRMCQKLKPGMSAIDFQRLLAEHRVLNITFAWDVREMAREVFHILAINFPSHRPTTIPHTVV